MTTSINFHLSPNDEVNVRLIKYGSGEVNSYPYAVVELRQGSEDIAVYVRNSDDAIEIAAAFARAATHLRDDKATSASGFPKIRSVDV